MHEQGWAGDIQRTLGRQDAGRKRGYGARCVTKADHQTKHGQAIQGLVPGVFAHGVVHHFDPFAAGDLFDPRLEVFGGVIDHMGSASFTRQGALGVAASRTDHVDTQGLGPLAEDQADATGSRVEQHRIPGMQTALRLGALEQVLHRQTFEHHGGPGLEADGVGQFAHAFGRHHAQLAICAGGLAGVGRTVTHLQVRHTRAHCLDHACGFHAQLQGNRQRIQAGAEIHVGVVQARRMVANAHLARAGLAHAQGDYVQLLGSAVLVDLDRAGRLGGSRHTNSK